MIDRLLGYLTQPVNQSTASLWITILMAGLITFGIRLSFILFFGGKEMPTWLRRVVEAGAPGGALGDYLPGAVHLRWSGLHFFGQ